jgi:Tfp pilus assembly pilus retraction ATPase PilT
MRDRETIEIALEAAETGHLVMSTLHTIDAEKTVERIVGVFAFRADGNPQPHGQEFSLCGFAAADSP